MRDVPPPDDGLYVGHRAAMDILDFQLEPTWMALQRPRQRILIADAVGLGRMPLPKTSLKEIHLRTLLLNCLTNDYS